MSLVIFLTVQLFADDVKIYTVIDEDSKIASLQDGFDNSVPGLLNGRWILLLTNVVFSILEMLILNINTALMALSLLMSPK